MCTPYTGVVQTETRDGMIVINTSANTMPRKLSILIVTWNSWNDLQRCLTSIYATDFDDFEVIVIDNGSSDKTVEFVRRDFPEVNLQCNDKNLGLPPAVNQGMRIATGDFIMLLDVDTELDSQTISRLLQFMREHPEVSLVAPRIYTPEGQIEQSARNLPSAIHGLFGRQSVLTRLWPNNPFSRRYLMSGKLDTSEPFRVEQVSAACMFMRRELFDDAGEWDEGYRCYWIDSDWCARLKELGKVLYCVPDARVVHYENNRAGKKKSVWRIWHFHMGAYRLYRKYYCFGSLDPRSLLAGLALTTRALIMLAVNSVASDAPDTVPTQFNSSPRIKKESSISNQPSE